MMTSRLRRVAGAVPVGLVCAALGGGEGPLADRGIVSDAGMSLAVVFDTGTGEPLLPESISFFVLASGCEAAQGIEVTLNGTSLGVFFDRFLPCTCSPPIQPFTVSDAALLRAAWNPAGQNTFRIFKPGSPRPGVGTSVGWISARIEASGANRTKCLFDFGGGSCSVRDICAARATEEAIAVETTLADPLLPELTVVATLPKGHGPGMSDCAVPPGGELGFVSDIISNIFPIALAEEVPRVEQSFGLASFPPDLAITGDGRFMLACDWFAGGPIPVVDVSTREVIGSSDPGVECNSIDICDDGTILTTSLARGGVRRLRMTGRGRLVETEQELALPGAFNVYCGAGSRSGVAVTGSDHQLVSFSVPALTEIDRRDLSGSVGLSAAIDSDSGRLYAYGTEVVEAYGYDEKTGRLSAAPALTIPLASGAHLPHLFGMEHMALDPTGLRLLVSELGGLNVYSARSGALLQSLTWGSPFGGTPTPTGICLAPTRP